MTAESGWLERAKAIEHDAARENEIHTSGKVFPMMAMT
jgi:hypothetical protein